MISTKLPSSFRMSKILSKDTKIEKLVFKALEDAGHEFERHVTSLPGKPDIILRKAKIAIFVDSDFWHGWKYAKWEHKLNEYWKTKITNTMKRDKRNAYLLRKQGWKVIRIWEHQLKRLDEILKRSIK